MSSFGGFGGFGQQNNTASSSPFGGGTSTFGQSNNNNTNTGFGGFGGGNSTNTFGQSTTGAGAFGSGNTGGTAFGTSTNNSTGLFGNKPASTSFGGSTSGGLFGNTANNNSSGFGGSTFGGATTGNTTFGNNSNTTGGSSLFGGSTNTNTTGFGNNQAKPLFGSGGAGTTNAFGSSFGAGAGGALASGQVPPCQGTGVAAFAPTDEKEPNGNVAKYQSITFQEPYKHYSFEELRLADYQKGQKTGNPSGTAGSFGATNFGFGNNPGTNNPFGTSTSTGSGLFGGGNNNTTTSSTGFGNNTATAGTFGTGGGGLFGGNNSTTGTGGLFGQQTSASTTGGLFGTTNNTNTGSAFGGFGSNNNNNQQSSGGLFGGAKPTGTSLFGGSTNNNTTTPSSGFSFGQQNNNQQNTTTGTGGLFGNTATTNTGSTLFGNNNQQNNTGGSGLFGNTNNQQSGGLFGNKPGGFGTQTSQAPASGGLFGNTANNTTTGGLFGQNNQQNNTSSGGLFGGNNNNNQQSGGLFGNTQNKPAGGLFGNTSTNTGSGLFGNNNNNNQQQTGGLFGNNNNQQQQQGGGLFGNTSTNTGGGLFGNNNNQQKPGGLFGTTQNNQQQGNSLFGNSGGMFNNSQNNQQQQMNNSQQVKHASLLDPNPYGQSSIWTGLPQPTDENSKPVFTPLTATQRLEESAKKPLPTLRLNQSRYMTPPRRSGYGLSYSTYGTPSSVASTPGGAPLSGSLYGGGSRWSGGSFGRSFNRSASVQNLRSQYAADNDDIWKQNAFAPSHRNSGGSIKRLTIDRSLRHDLFSRPPPQPALPAPKPDSNGEAPQQQITDGQQEPSRRLSKRVSFEKDPETTLNGESGALVRTEDDDESPAQRTNGAKTNGLNTVPEDRESHQVSSQPAPAKSNKAADQKPRDYWSKPTRQEIEKLPREQATAYKGFQIGREGCGYVVFNGTVDLTALPKDFDADLYDKVVVIEVRQVTVYPKQETKPPVGKGLNVPSTIYIENSWPRSKGKAVPDTTGRVVDRHVQRLKSISGTEFRGYEPETGVWSFDVPHYTRYGLDYDDDEEESMMDQSELSLPPHSFDKSADASVMEVDDHTDSQDEDTFAFKDLKQSQIPGQYGNIQPIPDDEDESYLNESQTQEQDDRSEQSAFSDEDMMSDTEQSPPMPGSLPPQAATPYLISPTKPTLKPIMPGTPGRPLLDLEGDWAEQLQRTISPRKQNRELLREAQGKLDLDKKFSPIKPKPAPQVNFRSSIDIMNSLFQPANKKANKAAEPDFEYPYAKRPKLFDPEDQEMTDQDRAWHGSFKPRFTTDGEILYKTSKPMHDKAWKEQPVTGDGNAVVVMGRPQQQKPYDLDSALSTSKVSLQHDVPTVKHQAVLFSDLAARIEDEEVADIYKLAHILFDDYEDEFTLGLSGPLQKTYAQRIRRDRLTDYLSQKVLAANEDELKQMEQVSPIKAAIFRLTAHDIKGACKLLKESKNPRLMLLVSQLDGADGPFMGGMRAQLDVWREQKYLSEIDLDIRTLYELVAGNVSISQGKEGKGVAIEDRAETFTISTRYNLTWLQVFALGLFYGRQEKSSEEGISTIVSAVREYQGRCDRGEEPTKPPENDVAWSLLKLYASKHDERKEIQAPQFPAALEGLKKPFNHSELFNFFEAMKSSLKIKADTAKTDELAETLAAELSAQGDLASPIYALSHISSTQTKRTLIQSLLDRFAATLPGADTATSDSGIALWQRLTIDLKVPTSWIYMSKARFAASATNQGGDNISELRYLIAAEAWNEAHECLLKRVAPALITDEDYQSLIDLCALFGDEPVRRVSTWYDGGEVFATFSQLMTSMIGKNDAGAISSLRKTIVTMSQQHSRGQGFRLSQLSQHELEEHVAIKEMANALAKLSQSGASVGEVEEVLQLPLTEDVRLQIRLAAALFDNKNSSAKDKSSRIKTRGLRLTQIANEDIMDEDTPEQNGHGA